MRKNLESTEVKLHVCVIESIDGIYAGFAAFVQNIEILMI